MANTIVVKGRGLRKERAAGGAINPGHLIEVTSTGTVVVHNSAGVNAAKLFAVENEIFGDDRTVAYASTDKVLYEAALPGQELYAKLAASATAVVIGSFLESAGDGTLRILTAFVQSGTTPFAVTPAGKPIAIAVEAVDNSAGGSEAYVLVEIL